MSLLANPELTPVRPILRNKDGTHCTSRRTFPAFAVRGIFRRLVSARVSVRPLGGGPITTVEGKAHTTRRRAVWIEGCNLTAATVRVVEIVPLVWSLSQEGLEETRVEPVAHKEKSVDTSIINRRETPCLRRQSTICVGEGSTRRVSAHTGFTLLLHNVRQPSTGFLQHYVEVSTRHSADVVCLQETRRLSTRTNSRHQLDRFPHVWRSSGKPRSHNSSLIQSRERPCLS